MKGNNIFLILTFTLACLPGHSATAGMYKWVDEQGVTHYSQNPPAAGKAQEVTPAPPPPADAGQAAERWKAQQQQLDKAREAREQEARERREKAASQTAREAACRTAQERLRMLETYSRVSTQDAEGKVTRLNEEERQAQIAGARKEVEQYCGK